MLSAAGASGTVAFAQSAPSLKVLDIKVEGAQSSSPAAIIAFSGIRVGDVIASSSDKIAKAIHNLMDRRLFSDVKIYVEPVSASPDGGVLVIVVKEYQRVANVAFEGSDEVSDKDLKELATIRSLSET